MLKIKEISLADDEELKQWIDTPGQEITEARLPAAQRYETQDDTLLHSTKEFPLLSGGIGPHSNCLFESRSNSSCFYNNW